MQTHTPSEPAEQAEPIHGLMTLLDQIAFTTTGIGLLVLLAAILIAALSVLPIVLSLTGH